MTYADAADPCRDCSHPAIVHELKWATRAGVRMRVRKQCTHMDQVLQPCPCDHFVAEEVRR